MNDEVLIFLKNLLFLFIVIFIGFLGIKLNLFLIIVKDLVSEFIVKVIVFILFFIIISSKFFFV